MIKANLMTYMSEKSDFQAGGQHIAQQNWNAAWEKVLTLLKLKVDVSRAPFHEKKDVEA